MFNTTRAGNCWEVYNVKERGDFPPDGMNMTVAVTENDPEVRFQSTATLPLLLQI